MKSVIFIFILTCILKCQCRPHRRHAKHLSEDCDVTNNLKVIISGKETEPIDVLSQIDNLDRNSVLCKSTEDILPLNTPEFKVMFKSISCPDILPKHQTKNGLFFCQQLTVKVHVVTRHSLKLDLLGEKETPPAKLDIGVGCVMAPRGTPVEADTETQPVRPN